MNPKLFGTSGIRKKVDELTPDFVRNLSLAVGTFSEDKDIAIGMDTRKSSPRLKEEFIQSLNSTGHVVVDLGVVPTPTLAIASEDYGTGVMITASVDGNEYTLVENLSTRERRLVKVGRFIDENINSKSFENFAVLSFNPKSGKVLFQRIKNVFRHAIQEPLYELKLSGGRKVKVTSSHSVFVYKDRKIVSIPTKDLRKGDLVAAPNYFPNFSFTPEIDLVGELLPFGEDLREIILRGPDIIELSRYKKLGERAKRVQLSGGGRNQILKKRKSLGLSRREMAKLAGICPLTIQRIELGTTRRFVKENSIKKYLEALEFEENNFLERFVAEERIFDQMLKHGSTFDGLKLKQLDEGDVGLIKECTLHGRGYPKNAVCNRLSITPDFARILGYYIAEGNLECDDRICFTLGHLSRGHEKYVVNDIKSFFKKSFGIMPKAYKRANTTKVVIDNVILFGLFANVFDFKKKSSLTKSVPSFVFTLPLNHRLGFLKGLFLGDGSLSKGKWIRFNSISEELITAVSYLLTQLGVKYSVAKRIDKRENRQPMHEIVIAEKESLEKIRPVWSSHWNANSINTSYKLKEKKHPQFNELLLLPIKEIKKVKPSSDFVYDFSVEGETFIAGLGGVCCHNSHNPPDWNGFKLCSGGMAFLPGQGREIEKIFYSKDFKTSAGGTIAKEDLTKGSQVYISKHIDRILQAVGIPSRRVKVLLDCANGSGSVLTPRLLERMGCEVIAINTELDGEFPHGLEPTAENLKEICKEVTNSGAEIGIVHDGDADRTAAINSEGKLIDWDSLLAVLASGKNKVVTTVDASMRVEDSCKEVVRTQIGDVAVANAIKREGADFGGEPSGSFIFPEVHLFPDGPLTAAKIVRLLSEGKFYETLSGIKSYPMNRLKIPCEEGSKVGIMENLRSVIKEKADYTDGIRVGRDTGWVLIRPSGTEPCIRITAEGRDRIAMDELVEEACGWLEQAII